MEQIQYSTNPFGGIIINPQSLDSDPMNFSKHLGNSLQGWSAQGFKVAWLELPTEKAALVSEAIKLGFNYHHATEDYLMLTKRIEEGAFIPPYASHYIGAGGVVISESDELLVVSERHRRSRSPAYKLPGGALIAGEHLADAVVREVFEETGVETEFQALVCFRHWHEYRYGKSDIYFVTRLSPLTTEITMQEEELDEALWMPVNDFLEDPDVSLFNKTIVQAALKSKGLLPTFVPGYGDESHHEFFMPKEIL